MGDMNNFPLYWVKTSNMHNNGARSPVFTFHIHLPRKLLIIDYLVPLSIGIKSILITVPQLSGYLLNLDELREGIHTL